MKKKNVINNVVNNDLNYQQGLSVDCVVFGFHDRVLKVLLSKFKFYHKWMLPVGFIMKNEDVDATACRVLKKRTGLSNVYLHQFHVFGNTVRPNVKEHADVMRKAGLGDGQHWISQRFISIGYYALVEYSKVNIHTAFDEDLRWFSLNEIPALYSDHNSIIEKALSTIRMQLRIAPICYKLLPEKFPLSELRNIYETILGKELDRRNFQRKILSTGYIMPLGESCKKPGLKPTALFSFNRDKCEEALNMI